MAPKKPAPKKKPPKRASKKKAAKKKAAKKKAAKKRPSGRGALRPSSPRKKSITGNDRFSKVTQKALAAACLKAGTFGAAADICGLPEGTVRRWIARGKKYWDDLDQWEENAEAGVSAPEPAKNKYADWSLAMYQARATFEAVAFSKILDAEVENKDGSFRPDWRAQAWVLERTNNKRYGRGALAILDGAESAGGEVDYNALILNQINIQSDREEAAKAKG